ncbi:MAG: type IV pilus modification PilV family protein [Isosphaeraceae bacterium]
MISPCARHRAAGGRGLDSPLAARGAPHHPRRGITLTEILIAIMILGIGLVSLATLFPIGILRLRDATRYTRSATLLQTAAADSVSRGMLDYGTFVYADNLNGVVGTPYWYRTPNSGLYNPMVQDTPYYFGDWFDTSNGVYIGANANPYINLGAANPVMTALGSAASPGLPVAYDPLWRFQTLSSSTNLQGYYIGDTYEARFGYGLTTVPTDPDGGVPSAHGLQRITNFNRPFIPSGNVEIPVMPASMFVPNVFVSQEDMVWQDPQSNTYTMNGVTPANGGIPVTGPSPVVPDLSPPTTGNPRVNGGTPSLDWRYSWMYTGQLTSAGGALAGQNSSAGSSFFDGNIVIFENRQFGIGPSIGPYSPAGSFSGQNYMVDGETVVEGVFGFSTTVIPPGGPTGGGGVGYGSAADRTVLLRWPEQLSDPVVRPGDWIADVTYERQASTVISRFYSYPQVNSNFPVGGLQNWTNANEWDNVPAQRCYWYQVMKVGTVGPDAQMTGFRSVAVFVNQSLVARTVLNSNGTPVHYNAALIAPNVVNVIPRTIYLRSNAPNNIP